MADLIKLADLIERYRTNGINFGTRGNAPEAVWIQMAEKRLGRLLPPSFKWFLNNYGGGEVCGEEVYSIYGPDFENAVGGDVVFQYLAHQQSKTLQADEIPVAQNDFGEIYYMKSMPLIDDEYRVWVKRGKTAQVYADSFSDFLEKRVKELCGVS